MRKNQRRGSKRVEKNAKRTRKQSRKVLRQSKQGISLARKLRAIIPDDTFFSSFRFHGNTKWHPSELVMLALVWGMSGSGFVTDAFAIASSACQSMFNSVPVATYQGMMHALEEHSIACSDSFRLRLTVRELLSLELRLMKRSFVQRTMAMASMLKQPSERGLRSMVELNWSVAAMAVAVANG